jgi:hypothetical protein
MSATRYHQVEVESALTKLQSLGFGHNKSDIWVEGTNFYCGLVPEKFKSFGAKTSLKPTRTRQKRLQKSTYYLLLGFDTEYQTAPNHISRCEIKPQSLELQNRILSYQCAAKLGDFAWEGIWCPEFTDRLSLGEFIVFALGSGLAQGLTQLIPSDIYLVAHFTRADIPAFSDFSELSWDLNNIRSTFVVMGKAIP